MGLRERNQRDSVGRLSLFYEITITIVEGAVWVLGRCVWADG